MPFSRGKRSFVLKTKKRKQQKTQKKGFRAKWGGPLGHLTWPLNPPKQKTKQKQKKKQKKKIRRAYGQVRWPFGPPHLKRKKDKNKKEKTKEIKQRTQKIPKKSFSVINQFFRFWWVSKISLFWQLDPKNTIKIGVSENTFLKNSSESRNCHFWTKKNQVLKLQLSFFLPFSSLTTTKNIKISWNPYFYSILANPKKIIFKI